MNNIVSVACVYLADASINIGSRTYYVDEVWVLPILLSPLLFCALVGIAVSLVRKKLNADFDRNINSNATDCNMYSVYKSGVAAAYIISAVLVIGTLILSIFVDSWITVALLFITWFTVAFFQFIDHIPNVLFKCPKCEKRKLVHFHKILIFASRTMKTSNVRHAGRKKIYFKCKSCGFDTVEDVGTWQRKKIFK